jgi:predicted Zn-dependent protease
MSGEDHDFEIHFYERLLRRTPKDAHLVELLGGLYSRKGRVDDGLRMDRKLVRLQPDNPTAHYNLACSLALKRRKADSLRALREAVERGYVDAEWMRQDPDLEVLWDHPQFQRLVQELERTSFT